MYNGNITAIIDKLHLLHLDDVLLEEPSLEEIFLHYYASGGVRHGHFEI
jgi:ABC-2 type transport system ATP-binding protein